MGVCRIVPEPRIKISITPKTSGLESYFPMEFWNLTGSQRYPPLISTDIQVSMVEGTQQDLETADLVESTELAGLSTPEDQTVQHVEPDMRPKECPGLVPPRLDQEVGNVNQLKLQRAEPVGEWWLGPVAKRAYEPSLPPPHSLLLGDISLSGRRDISLRMSGITLPHWGARPLTY